MPTPEDIRARFAAYVAAIESRDRDALLACFTEDALQIDPYPSAPNVGRDAIGAFFDQTFTLAEKLVFTVGEVVIGGDRGVFPFSLLSTLPDGAGTLELNAVDVITVNDAGLITEITAYVDFAGARQV